MDKVSSGTDKITVTLIRIWPIITELTHWRKSGSVDWVSVYDVLLIDGTADTDPLVPVDTDIELGNSANPDHAMILENESNLPVTFILTFTDQAGNESPWFTVPEFTIDRTKPEIDSPTGFESDDIVNDYYNGADAAVDAVSYTHLTLPTKA